MITKKLVMTLAVVSFVAACAKKNDDHGTVPAVPQANSPLQTADGTTTAPKVPNTGEAGKSQSPSAAQAAGAEKNKKQHAGSAQQKEARHGFGAKEAILPPEANYDYSGTADDNLNMVLAGLSSGNTDAETQADNNLKAKQISSASLVRGADGSVTVVLEVPESTVAVSSVQAAGAKKSLLEQQDVQDQNNDVESAQVAEVLGEASQVVKGDDLDQVAAKSATAISVQAQQQSGKKAETKSEKKSETAQAKAQPKQVKAQAKAQEKVATKQKTQAQKAPQFIKQHQIVLKGMILKNQEARLYASNSLSKNLGTQASLKCYDADGGCNTAVVTVNFGDIKKEQKVQIIFRTSVFNYSVKYPNTQIRDSLYEKFIGLFKNSRYADKIANQESNLLKFRKMESFEVINGRSAVKVTLQSYENEILTFKFAGLKDDQQGGFNEVIDKNVSLEDGLTLAQGETFSTQLSDAISEARLVGNNGRGVFNLSLKMKALESSNDDTVDLTLTRTQSKIKY